MRQYKPNRTSCSNTVQRLGSRNRTNAMMVSWTLQREGLRKSNERKRVHEYASLNAGDKPSGKSGGVLAKDGPATKTKAKKKTIKPSDMVTPLMTDAQKAANTTRGLTPGLINKDLGEVPGNRVPWPDKSKLAGHHHAKKSQRAPRKKGIGSRRIDREARQSQGPSTQQPLDVGDSAILEGDQVSPLAHFYKEFVDLQTLQDTVSDDGTELASEQFSESTGLEEASGEESLEHGDAPSGDQTDEDSQSEAEMPHKNLRLWVQPAPPHAPRGITASHRTVASRGEPSWSYSIPPRAEMEPDNDNDWHMPGNFLSNAPARDLATQPHFPPPSQASHASSSTHHQTSSHQKRLAFPGTINDPAHPLYIPPFPVQAAAKEQTVIPTAVAAHQQAPMNNNLGNGNGNQQASATAGPPTASSAQIPPRITDHVRLTCPDNLTPSRWAEFLEFCVIHGIGRRDQSPDQLAPSEANTNRTSDQTLSRGLENQDGQAEWTVQDEQDEEWERSLRQ